MRAIIFAGPSLPPHARPACGGIDWRPPVRQGDVYRAALSHPGAIGVVDGFFEVTPTVWHKEILWAMAQGIHVYGAASIGALRAAELDGFGMKGVGQIYENFRDGVLQDDDEVAVLHGPEALGYVVLTEAMVNVRATVEAAVRAGVVEPAAAAAMTGVAKALFYKNRTYSAIVKAAADIEEADRSRIEAWLTANSVDQKRADAAAMVEQVRADLGIGVPPLRPAYRFAHTSAWEENVRRASDPPAD
jgi:hypothetical protein